MRPCTAGQKRFSLRFSQIAQLTGCELLKHYATWIASVLAGVFLRRGRKWAILKLQLAWKAVFSRFSGASVKKSA
ncbi:MAG: hypothetical protein DMG89_10565 [Acidobacteria bacterium]|nr:MAG: hypothetical protein DMG89_10565 [Acidobacteriota bacterium]